MNILEIAIRDGNSRRESEFSFNCNSYFLCQAHNKIKHFESRTLVKHKYMQKIDFIALLPLITDINGNK